LPCDFGVRSITFRMDFHPTANKVRYPLIDILRLVFVGTDPLPRGSARLSPSLRGRVKPLSP